MDFKLEVFQLLMSMDEMAVLANIDPASVTLAKFRLDVFVTVARFVQPENRNANSVGVYVERDASKFALVIVVLFSSGDCPPVHLFVFSGRTYTAFTVVYPLLSL